MVQVDIRMGPRFRATIPFLLIVLLVLLLDSALPVLSTRLPLVTTRG